MPRFAALALLCALPCLAAGQPNIVFLLADDLGWGDLGVYGGRLTLTPHLDALAASGVKFENHYSTSAVCTPARASLMTGRYPLRFGITAHFPDDERHLPRGTVTLPGLLRQAGYRTAHIGKWHLGGLHQVHIDDRANSIPGPLQHGFDEYLTQLEDPPIRSVLGREKRLFRDGGQHLVRNDRNAPADPRHYEDINAAEAVAAIERFHAEGRPFFLNVWFVAPHMPYEPAPEPFYAMYEGWASGDQRKFRSMLSHLDAKVGEIVGALDRLGLRDNTLVVFTSDNGGAWESDIGPWKGGKTDLHDGGLRVPFLASWPGAIPAGAVSRQVATHADVVPTVLAAAGLPAPSPIDGIDLLPQLTGRAPEFERGPLLWQIDLYPRLQRHYDKPQPYATEAVRDGRWKLLSRDGEPVELFDLEADPRERQNLLYDRPEIVQRLAPKIRQFLAEPRQSPLPPAPRP